MKVELAENRNELKDCCDQVQPVFHFGVFNLQVAQPNDESKVDDVAE